MAFFFDISKYKIPKGYKIATKCIIFEPNRILCNTLKEWKFRLLFRNLRFYSYLCLHTAKTMKQHRKKNIAIILLFALLHLGVAVISRLLDYHDDILLTVLTITMVIILSMRNNVRMEVMAFLTLIATLCGYIIGSWLWQPLNSILHNETIAPGISTFIITLTMGLFTDVVTRRAKGRLAHHGTWNTSARNIIGAAISILVLRLLYYILFSAELQGYGTLLGEITNILSNTWALLIIIVGNIIVATRIPDSVLNNLNRNTIFRSIYLSIIIIPIITAVVSYYNLPAFNNNSFALLPFVRTLSAALLMDILTITICTLARLSTISQQGLREEREQKHRSEYQYERLKQQLNPHFLFNSLGILDYLVQEQETERASAFIRKLASTYRYMLNNEQKPLVKLSEELEFTNMYIDLLKERFTEGMQVAMEIDEENREKMVVPCALQLLVENATKHNIVSGEQPLHINIYTEEGYIIIRNILQLRTHGQPSTRLGLKNISQQYHDITGMDIIIEKTDTEFIVKLPLI